MTLETIKTALRHAGTYLFRHESGYSDYDAERNLQGRTHFADPQTRRYFKSRILDASVSHDGLVYWLIESNRSKPYESAKNKRFVAFDVFGTQLFERDSWHKTSKAAHKEGKDWLASFDAIAHTETELRAKARRDARNSQAILEALAGYVEVI
jgi:hypothetical protein